MAYAYKPMVKPLVNRDGEVIGRLERDVATGIVTPFWYPKPRTMALPAQEPDQKWRCPQCLTYLPIGLDDTGQYIPCTTCGYAAWVAPSAAGTRNIPATAVPVSFSAPATLDRVVALQSVPGLVAEVVPAPVVARRVPHPTARETYAPFGSTMDRLVEVQVARGQREAPALPLRTMVDAGSSLRCPRCGATDYRTCPCPPTMPSVLEAAVVQNRRRQERQDAAFEAEHPVLAAHWRRRA